MTDPGWPAEFERRFDVSRESWSRLAIYVSLLRQWQARINLVAPSTLPDIWERHIADSLQLLPHLKSEAHVIADLGSGAGLPGLVLGLVRPVTVHLYEANGKKIAFLNEVIRRTGIQAKTHQIRLENLSTAPVLPQVDIVTARALAPLDTLLDYAWPFLSAGATGLFLKGQDVDNELTVAAKSWRIGYHKHVSVTDSKAAILEIREVHRVQS